MTKPVITFDMLRNFSFQKFTLMSQNSAGIGLTPWDSDGYARDYRVDEIGTDGAHFSFNIFSDYQENDMLHIALVSKHQHVTNWKVRPAQFDADESYFMIEPRAVRAWGIPTGRARVSLDSWDEAEMAMYGRMELFDEPMGLRMMIARNPDKWRFDVNDPETVELYAGAIKAAGVHENVADVYKAADEYLQAHGVAHRLHRAAILDDMTAAYTPIKND